jgi:alpha-N-arabinofuranosidase
VRVDPNDRLSTVDRRLFGSFVEHLGRCVYGGVFEPGSPFADVDGDRVDVIQLVNELGVTIVRYPGGNFVSGYRWEDGIGPAESRPTRLDLAWRSIEDNQFGIHEFMRWAGKAAVEPMMAVNLGTRGIQEACDLVEYMNHPGGTRLSDTRRANGADGPFAVKLWCLGNEVDGPWQVGHKTPDEYGRLAAESAKAMRQVDPTIELVACGSSHAAMPTFGSWESTVLDHTMDHVDYLSLHAYYEQHDNDSASFLASGHAMDQFIDGVVATVDAVAARKGTNKKLHLSFDEWNVWYQSRFQGHTALDWAHAPALIEDTYNSLDAVVVGGLMMALLRHADRVKVACLAQLVNAIAPIRTERDQRAWKQSIFHPFALTARHASGEVVRTVVESSRHDTERHGQVDTVDVVATINPDDALSLFVLNRHPDQRAELTLSINSGAYSVVEEIQLGACGRPNSTSGSDPSMFEPRRSAHHSPLPASWLLPPATWTLIRCEPTPTS